MIFSEAKTSPLAQNMETKNQVLVCWKYHPFQETPLKGILVLFFCLFLLLFLEIEGHSSLLILGFSLFLFMSLASYYLPTYYWILDGEILVRNLFTQRHSWEKWSRFEELEDAFQLSPFSQPSFLDAYRGLLLLLPQKDRENLKFRIRPILERKIKERRAP
ncbi:MAG: hypothetical protein D6785_12270 [Planctomycetota bacterium]|nr:MAG: hypothetical protein D6785_12270 [Planctomycetota bacterium]